MTSASLRLWHMLAFRDASSYIHSWHFNVGGAFLVVEIGHYDSSNTSVYFDERKNKRFFLLLGSACNSSTQATQHGTKRTVIADEVFRILALKKMLPR